MRRLIVIGQSGAHVAEWAGTRNIPKSMIYRVACGDDLHGVAEGTPHVLLEDWDDGHRSQDVHYIHWKLRELESPNVGAGVDWLIQWMWQHPRWDKRK